ncbi:alpha-N-acetylglucosaminidase [Streptomyces sp. NPDC004134]|uniref:alpha-N-acetylglucosaminidase n=1 Tax=Streptomyces sp. NPDC004134 TaxID=3364691 RepID=UPI0036C73230
MTDMTRRTILGTAGALGAGAALVGGQAQARSVTAGGGTAAAAGRGFEVAAAREALERLLPDHAGQFALTALDGEERFTVRGRTGRIEVGGTSPAVLLTGVHWYLKYTCRAVVSWSGSQTRLPRRLPAPAAPVERRATVPARFALNDTHDGYTGPYHDWARWERFVDVLALHGCNQVLVTPGTEAVYHRLLQDFGYSDAEARAWLPAPSHQPWWLLQNMSDYGGPVSPALLAERTELGRRVTARMRELGISPVLPGYFGTVPGGFADRNPGARTVPQGTWAGLPRPDWLDPRTDVFRDVAAAFYRHQEDLFGPVGHLKMDLLHEGGDPGDVPVPEAARAVETALQTARPGATWVILGWQENPRRELLEGLAHPDRMLVVDGLSDLERVTDREADWGGVPYAFGTIPNFGGRTTIGAKTHMWAERFAAWRDKPGSACVGTAYMPEAAERDPAALELFSELAWRDEPVDRKEWFDAYAAVRYGGADPAARAAFAALRETAYAISSADGRPHDSVFAARPSLDARSGAYYATKTPAFDLAEFDKAFGALLGVAPALRASDAYRHDLVDLARQALASRSRVLLPQLKAAYERGDAEGAATFRTLSDLWLKLMALSDETTGAHRAFLLGPWLADARRMAADDAEAALLERTARVLVTTWADRPTADGGHLADYANRDWSGLIRDFHAPRWRAYLEELQDALAAGREPEPFDWYAVEDPWTRQRNRYPERPSGNAHTLARRVHEVLATAPYQGFVTAVADPPALAPGGTGRLTAGFRNMCGLAATGAVELELTGLDAAPPGAVSLPAVPAAGRAEHAWEVRAPAGPPAKPLTPLAYEVRTAYGMAGQDPVTVHTPGTLFVAGPLDDSVATVTTNAAVFGQLGDRWAVDGGGADMWKATAEFGAVFRPGSLASGGTVTLTVDAQAPTGPWARAGIVARNDLRTAGAAGFLNLAVTPANGVVLSYDSNGDGTLDTYRRITGVTAPVTLRLTRAGDTFTGACSTDAGATWRTVATVTVPGTAGTQDAGLFMSAAAGVRGTVEFGGWTNG